MTPADFLRTIIDPGLAHLEALGGPRSSDEARRFLLAAALQESGPRLEARYQHHPATTPGPARGWWQFEQGGGVHGVLNHRASTALARAALAAHEVAPENAAVWRTLEGHDVLATVFARLLLWTDPDALPRTQAEGWTQYSRLWRPGKPKPETWPNNWRVADETVRLA